MNPFLIFRQGTWVHGDDTLDRVNDRGSDGLGRDHHSAVRCSTPHLHPVNRKVRNTSPLSHSGIGEDVPDHQHALSPEPTNDHGVIERVVALSFGRAAHK